MNLIVYLLLAWHLMSSDGQHFGDEELFTQNKENDEFSHVDRKYSSYVKQAFNRSLNEIIEQGAINVSFGFGDFSLQPAGVQDVEMVYLGSQGKGKNVLLEYLLPNISLHCQFVLKIKMLTNPIKGSFWLAIKNQSLIQSFNQIINDAGDVIFQPNGIKFRLNIKDYRLTYDFNDDANAYMKNWGQETVDNALQKGLLNLLDEQLTESLMGIDLNITVGNVKNGVKLPVEPADTTEKQMESITKEIRITKKTATKKPLHATDTTEEPTEQITKEIIITKKPATKNEAGKEYLKYLKKSLEGLINNLFEIEDDFEDEGYSGHFKLIPVSLEDVDIKYVGIGSGKIGVMKQKYSIPKISVKYKFSFFVKDFGELNGTFTVKLTDQPFSVVYIHMLKQGKWSSEEKGIDYKVNMDGYNVIFSIEDHGDGMKSKFEDLGKRIINTFVRKELSPLLVGAIKERLSKASKIGGDDGRSVVTKTPETQPPPRPKINKPVGIPADCNDPDHQATFLKEFWKVMKCTNIDLSNHKTTITHHSVKGKLELSGGTLVMDYIMKKEGDSTESVEGGSNVVSKYRIPTVRIKFKFVLDLKTMGTFKGSFGIVISSLLVEVRMFVKENPKQCSYRVKEGIQIKMDYKDYEVNFHIEGGTMRTSMHGWAQNTINTYIIKELFSKIIPEVQLSFVSVLEILGGNGGKAPSDKAQCDYPVTEGPSLLYTNEFTNGPQLTPPLRRGNGSECIGLYVTEGPSLLYATQDTPWLPSRKGSKCIGHDLPPWWPIVEEY